jgi:hypothetical protein
MPEKKQMVRVLCIVAGALTSGVSVFGQDGKFDKILFPVINYSAVDGALGSRWITDVSVLNTSSSALIISGGFVCLTCRITPKLPPGITFRVLPPSNAFLLVEEGHGSEVRATVRIHDLSRDFSSGGTEVPIARESDFSPDHIDLLGIPVDGRYRRTLRIYSFDPVAADVLVRVYLEPDGSYLDDRPVSNFVDTFVGEVKVHLNAPDMHLGWWETSPGYAEVGDAVLPASSVAGTERFEIRLLSSGTRIWGFVSLTNNGTQAVTIIAPH